MVYTLIRILLWASVSPAAPCARLLLNAEPFGFGPSAAIAQLAPRLREHSKNLAYIGEGHTLDLQRGLGYDEVVALPPGASEKDINERLQLMRRWYSHFVTATDFRYAELAKAAGYKVAVYDPLLWYWQPMPPGMSELDLYVAQNFIGVKERELGDSRPREMHLIPPLTRALERHASGNFTTLINLGGLQNPYYKRMLLSSLAELLIDACRKASPTSQIEIATNTFISRAPFGAKTFTPAQIAATLEHAAIAFMTSGLGNLIEASSASTPVVWLPPTNDSQGQQIALLARSGMIDARIDWNDFDDLPPIDYFKPQPLVMAEIKNRMENLIASSTAQARLREALKKETIRLSQKKRTALNIRRLVDRFGQNGIDSLAAHVQRWATVR